MTPVQGCRELRGCVVIAHCGSPCQELSHPRLFPVPSFPRIPRPYIFLLRVCVCVHTRAQSCDKLVTLVNLDEFSVRIRHDGYKREKKIYFSIEPILSQDIINILPKCDLKCSFQIEPRATLWSKILFYPENILAFWDLLHDFSYCVRIYFESDFDGEKYSVNMEQLNFIRGNSMEKLSILEEYTLCR